MEVVRVGVLVRGYVQVARAVVDVEVTALINVVAAVKVDVITLAGIIVSILVLIIALKGVQKNVVVALRDAGVALVYVVTVALLIVVMPV